MFCSEAEDSMCADDNFEEETEIMRDVLRNFANADDVPKFLKCF